jgi:ATP-dependent Lhr-like helicase
VLHHQRRVGPAKWKGREGLHELIALLQGYEAPAGSWEYQIFPARMEQYEPRWLDELMLQGEVSWARLSQRNTSAARRVTMHRGLPLTFFERRALPWLLENTEKRDLQGLSHQAAKVYGCLEQFGALFPIDLVAATGLLPAEVWDALLELAAEGLVTSDTFSALRERVAAAFDLRRLPRRHRSRSARRPPTSPAGRWSLFPGYLRPAESAERLEQWAWQLLRRYGVVFRDLLRQEPLAPPWGSLVRVLRRLELSGHVRGGLFVEGVSGEQYALPEAVERLRGIDGSPEPVVMTAVDPAQLAWLCPGEPMVPSVHTGAMVWWKGRVVASMQGMRVELFGQLPTSCWERVLRDLQRLVVHRSCPSLEVVHVGRPAGSGHSAPASPIPTS